MPAAEQTAKDEAASAMLAALKGYAANYCEGWCAEATGTFEDCGGCKARAAIAQAEAAGLKSGEG